MNLIGKIIGDLKLDYDVVEDLKKMKANITIFGLCKITQMREQLREPLQHIQGPQDVEIGNSKETLKGKNTKATKSAKTTSVASPQGSRTKRRQLWIRSSLALRKMGP